MSRNRYVRDYRLVETVDSRGRIRTDYEYIVETYVFLKSDREVRRAKRRVWLCCALGWIGCIGAMLPESNAMRTLWIALPFVFSILPLALLTGMALQDLRAAQPFEHRWADRLENRYPACTFLLTALAALAFLLGGISALVRQALTKGDIAFLAGAGTLAICACVCFRQRGSFGTRKNG